MKKLSKKAILLLISMMALAAFAMPSLASAATWSAPGTITGHSPALVFTEVTAFGSSTVSCTTQFTGDALNAAGVGAGSITSITFGTVSAPCSGGGISTGCTSDVLASALPWPITTSGTTLTVSRISANITFTGSCTTAGTTLVMTGSLTGAWTNGSGTANTLTLVNAGPLATTLSGSPFGSAALDGAFRIAGPHL